MRLPPPPHDWTLSPTEAVAVQRRLAPRVRVAPLRRAPELIAGVDAAFDRDDCVAGVVLWRSSTGETLETHVVRRPVTFPYVPGLLSFREAPALLDALARLDRRPDLLMCDGQGLAHPRRFGIACHLGVLTRLPAVGVAKSRLCGEHREPAARRGSRRRLTDRGEVIGAVLRTRDGVRPVFVSVGHRTDLDGAIAATLHAATGYRLPEPTRLADRLVAAAKRGPAARG